MKLSYFGEVSIPDGALAVMDGGIHGVSGHTVVVGADGVATWERRLDSLQPIGRVGSGRFQLTAEELSRVARWRDRAWETAAGERLFFSGARADQPPPVPRWVWAVVVRRGDEVRTLEGGSIRPTEGAPDGVRDLLEWLIRRVDGLAGN